MKRLMLVAMLFLFGLTTLNAQEAKEQTTVITLNKFCCGETTPIIEKTLAYEKGVKSFEVNEKEKNVKVVYKTKSTDPTKIATALAKVGIEANGIEADKRAIEKLPTCCKNTAKGEGSGCSGHSH